MRPRAALPTVIIISSPVRRLWRGPGSQRRCVGGGVGASAPALPPRRSRSPSAVREKAETSGGARVVGDPTAGLAQRRAGGRDAQVGSKRPGAPVEGENLWRRWREALSPPLPRARTGVSPALPWNALGCVGAGAPALCAGPFGCPVAAAAAPRSKPTSAGAQRSTQNWHGPGESDCLIKTKHCDGQRWMLTQCDFCPVL